MLPLPAPPSHPKLFRLHAVFLGVGQVISWHPSFEVGNRGLGNTGSVTEGNPFVNDEKSHYSQQE